MPIFVNFCNITNIAHILNYFYSKNICCAWIIELSINTSKMYTQKSPYFMQNMYISLFLCAQIRQCHKSSFSDIPLVPMVKDNDWQRPQRRIETGTLLLCPTNVQNHRNHFSIWMTNFWNRIVPLLTWSFSTFIPYYQIK